VGQDADFTRDSRATIRPAHGGRLAILRHKAPHRAPHIRETIMTTRTLLPAFIILAAANGPQLLAQAPAEPNQQPAVAEQGRCASAAPSARNQVKHRALMGFARSLAGNLPMMGRGSVAASVAGQTASAALDGAAAAESARPSPCAAG
jgi:hypothetical protein